MLLSTGDGHRGENTSSYITWWVSTIFSLKYEGHNWFTDINYCCCPLCTLRGQIDLRLTAVVDLRQCCQINHSVSTDNLCEVIAVFSDIGEVKGLPLLLRSHRSTARIGTYCALSVSPSGEASLDFTTGTGGDRRQMIWDDSKPIWLIPLVRPTEPGEHGYSRQRPSICRPGRGASESWPGLSSSPSPRPTQHSVASSELRLQTSLGCNASHTAGIKAKNNPLIYHSSTVCAA